MPSEAWESHDESSRLGLLDLEDSAEESWEECCETALEPQDAALLLNRPLAVLLLVLLLSRLAAVDGTAEAGAGGGGGGRESIGAVVPVLVTAGVEDASTGEGKEEVVDVGWPDVETDEAVVSIRGIFICGGGVPKLPSSSMNRLGVLMIRRETVLTTGIMNCLMFFSWVFLMPASMAPVAVAPLASFSSRFCAPFFARCSSCLAMVASVRLEGGTILTGFL